LTGLGLAARLRAVADPVLLDPEDSFKDGVCKHCKWKSKTIDKAGASDRKRRRQFLLHLTNNAECQQRRFSKEKNDSLFAGAHFVRRANAEKLRFCRKFEREGLSAHNAHSSDKDEDIIKSGRPGADYYVAVLGGLRRMCSAKCERYAQTFDSSGAVCKTASGMCSSCTGVRDNPACRARQKTPAVMAPTTNNRFADDVGAVAALKTAMSKGAAAKSKVLRRKISRRERSKRATQDKYVRAQSHANPLACSGHAGARHGVVCSVNETFARQLPC